MSSKQIYLRAMELAKQSQGAPLPIGATPAEPKIRPRFASPRREILVFVSLGAEDPIYPGNFCKAGPAFKGIKRLTLEQRLNVIFKLPGVDAWTKAAAKVVWVGSSGQSCGLEFVDIADDSRRMVDNWLTLRGQAGRQATDPGSQSAPAVTTSASPGFELESYQIVLPVEAIEFVPGPQSQSLAPAPVAAQAKTRPIATASRSAASLPPKSAAGYQPAAPLPLTAAAAGIRLQTKGMQGKGIEKGIKIDRKTVGKFALALIGFAAMMFLVGEVKGRLQGGPPHEAATAQREVSPTPTPSAAAQSPLSATENSVEALPAKTEITPAPVRSSPFEMPTERPNSLKGIETPPLQRTPNLAVGAASRPFADRPARAQQIVHSVAPSAAVPPVSAARSAALPAAMEVEPRPTPPSDPISARATEPAIPPAAVETAPVPAAAIAVNSETLTGSIEIIPDLYPSIRMPAQSQTKPSTKPSGPAALTIGRLLSKTEPIYPPDALRQRISGTVKLHVLLGADGRVETAVVTDGPMQISNAALQAVKQWRYEPTLLGTAPVEAEEDIVMIFRIATSLHSGT